MNTTFTTYATKAKQFLNLLQGYTKGIRITAILILLLMGASNAWAAKQRYIYIGLSNDYHSYKKDGEWGINFLNGTSPGVKVPEYLDTKIHHDGRDYYMYRVYVYDNHTQAEFKGNNSWWKSKITVDLDGTTKNSVFFSAAADKWEGAFQIDYQVTSSVSLAASKTSVLVGDNVTLTPSLSSNTTYNTIKSTSYTISPNTGATISNNTFKATKAGTYTVTATVTYNATDFTGITKTATTTKTIKVYETHYVLRGSINATGDPKGGMAGWDATNNNAYTVTTEGNIMTIVANLTDAKTQYKFMIYNCFDDAYYGQTGGAEIPNNTSWTLNGSNDVKFTTTAAGPYTFIYNTSNKSIKVQYPTAYTVTYSRVPTAAANPPTTSPSISSGDYVLANTFVTFNAKAANTGYTWKGWYDNNAGTGDALSTTLAYARSITANTTIYAVYITNTYSVKFDANGGSGTMSDQNFIYGTSQNLTANAFSRTGYTFAGWATSANENKVYDDKQSVSNLSSTNGATVTLYAKWTPVNYTITYNTNGGSGTMNPTSYTIETATFDLPTPTKDGCTFVGWYDNAELTGEKITRIETGSYGSKTFYAKWDAEKFTLKWDENGGTITTPGSPEGGEVEAGTPLKAPIVTKEHYDHTGWTPEEPTVMPGEDVTYIAQWTPTEYTITYHLNGGNGTMTPTTYTIESETFALPDNPTKAGHTFAGWYANAELTGEDVTQIEKGSTGDKAYWAKWNVASYTINFDLEEGTGVTTPLTVQYGAQLPNITIPTKAGYLFLGYYNGDNGTGTQYYDASGKGLKTMPANNLTLHAKWLNGSDCIFFYNNLGWSNVYVYFYSSDKYWDDSKGTGSQKEKTFPQDGDAEHKPHYREYRGQMTKIEGTNIWYYNRSVHGDITRENYTTVAFTKDQQNNYEFFNNTEVVRRGDFNSNIPMFVSIKKDARIMNQNGANKSTYYNYGYWMNYPTNTGYTLKIYNKVEGDDVQEWRSIPFEYSEDMMMPLALSVSGMEGGKTYGFKILRADNKWYGNNGTMTTNSSGDVGQTAWEFTTEVNDNCGLTTTAAGTYVFTLKYGKDRNNNYNYLVGVEYPASVGDYRLAYKDNAHPFHPGHLLKKRDGKDTVSFFVHHDPDLRPVIMLQKVKNINANTGAITWDNISTTEINGISATGIYNFILEQSGNEATLSNTITEYTGDFYIRTDATAGGWGNFRQNSNKMTYTSYAENQEKGFNHYFVEWINAGTNVKFTIANDYSYCLSDSLNADDIVTTGNLPKNANVRFGWNSKTNELSRAYISGSSNTNDRFLVIKGNEHLKDAGGQPLNRDGLEPNWEIFKDMGNWIYQVDVTANRNTMISLSAMYNEQEQLFKSENASDEGMPILVSDAQNDEVDDYQIRLVYDFKTNHLIAAWLLPLEENHLTGTGALETDMMVIRKNQNRAQQITFESGIERTGVKTAYAVMTFDKQFVNDNSKSIYERALYWVSFPFNVCIRDVFGFGEYMDTWIMEYYDGEARAKNGAWVDSESYWTYMTNVNDTLKAGVGYILCLDLEKMTPSSTVFQYTDEVSLYFPSNGNVGTISNTQMAEVSLTALPCKIERDNRNIYDANWHAIGVPKFADLSTTIPGADVPEVEFAQDKIGFYYEYLPTTNTYAVSESGSATFKSMYAYMVQYTGTLYWSTNNITSAPASIAARRNVDSGPEKVSLRLEIAQDETAADKTFIQLQEEGATSDFDMNIDLTKIINAGANIYTLAGEQRIQSAGNAIPMEEAIVPVGVKVDAEGEYTFRMPDGTEGMVVELIDYYTNTRTNLLLFDYTVDLSAGTCNDRFALHIQPSKSGVTTNIDQINGGSMHHEGVQKYLINGQLYIVREGVVYDAQGHRL